MNCSSDLCTSASCVAYDNSVCEIDSCSNCTIKHYVGLQDVTNRCGEFLKLMSRTTCVCDMEVTF